MVVNLMYCILLPCSVWLYSSQPLLHSLSQADPAGVSPFASAQPATYYDSAEQSSSVSPFAAAQPSRGTSPFALSQPHSGTSPFAASSTQYAGGSPFAAAQTSSPFAAAQAPYSSTTAQDRVVAWNKTAAVGLPPKEEAMIYSSISSAHSIPSTVCSTSSGIFEADGMSPSAGGRKPSSSENVNVGGDGGGSVSSRIGTGGAAAARPAGGRGGKPPSGTSGGGDGRGPAAAAGGASSARHQGSLMMHATAGRTPSNVSSTLGHGPTSGHSAPPGGRSLPSGGRVASTAVSPKAASSSHGPSGAGRASLDAQHPRVTAPAGNGSGGTPGGARDRTSACRLGPSGGVVSPTGQSASSHSGAGPAGGRGSPGGSSPSGSSPSGSSGRLPTLRIPDSSGTGLKGRTASSGIGTVHHEHHSGAAKTHHAGGAPSSSTPKKSPALGRSSTPGGFGAGGNSPVASRAGPTTSVAFGGTVGSHGQSRMATGSAKSALTSSAAASSGRGASAVGARMSGSGSGSGSAAAGNRISTSGGSAAGVGMSSLRRSSVPHPAASSNHNPQDLRSSSVNAPAAAAPLAPDSDHGTAASSPAGPRAPQDDIAHTEGRSPDGRIPEGRSPEGILEPHDNHALQHGKATGEGGGRPGPPVAPAGFPARLQAFEKSESTQLMEESGLVLGSMASEELGMDSFSYEV